MKDGATRPIPVRLHAVLVSRIERAATQLGLTTSAVMRLAIVNQLSQIEEGYIRITAEDVETRGAFRLRQPAGAGAAAGRGRA